MGVSERIELAPGRDRIRLEVTNTSARVVRVSSHYPFWRTNRRLEFDREAARGFRLDVPADTLGAVLPVLARLRAVPRTPATRGSWYLLEGEIPAARVHELQQALPALTRGEGVLECAFDHYQPVRGPVPTRPRSDHNPRNREEYLLHVMRRV